MIFELGELERGIGHATRLRELPAFIGEREVLREETRFVSTSPQLAYNDSVSVSDSDSGSGRARVRAGAATRRHSRQLAATRRIMRRIWVARARRTDALVLLPRREVPVISTLNLVEADHPLGLQLVQPDGDLVVRHAAELKAPRANHGWTGVEAPVVVSLGDQPIEEPLAFGGELGQRVTAADRIAEDPVGHHRLRSARRTAVGSSSRTAHTVGKSSGAGTPESHRRSSIRCRFFRVRMFGSTS